MPVSDPPLVLSCVDGHVDICRQSCRQLSTNRQAYSQPSTLLARADSHCRQSVNLNPQNMEEYRKV